MKATTDSDDEGFAEKVAVTATPGVVVITSACQPAGATIAITRAASGVVIGRGAPHGLLEEDVQVSRSHLRISLQDDTFQIEDLDSRNGTFLDGVRLEGAATRSLDSNSVLRLGRSLLWLVPDVRPFIGHQPPSAAGPVLGGLSRRALEAIAIADKVGDTLLILGESGAGKELCARTFHEVHFGTDGRAPFVAVNCAAIPEGLAERLLFGARRGAFSGATDANGYIAEAHGGTLFLDEVAELDPLVQAKLLRVLETREVMALGATSARKVQLRICAATHTELRNAVNEGRFRADLYYRIGRPEVRMPALRERLDELPYFLQRALAAVGPQLTAAIATLEMCALRRWPGNVRELLLEAKHAAHAALTEGVQVVRPDHFAPSAGLALTEPSSGPVNTWSSKPPSDSVRSASAVDDAAIEAALAEHGGNVSRAAQALGLHRNQLRRWIAKRGGDDK
ncbi:MAG TPA: sigma 54-interacting transcriptional regulator [Polyangiales bacterium]|nr:sigma 54-interacting transcriptional regulator [Polyangiales bacterium]